MSFYLGRRIAIAGGRGELDFGAAQEEDPRWFLNAEQLRRLWNGPDRVLLAASRRRLEELTREVESGVRARRGGGANRRVRLRCRGTPRRP